MSTDRAAEIRARADQATPGPWEAKQNTRRGNTTVILNADGQFVAHYVNPTDAEFLAAARQDIPHLLDLLDQVREYADDLVKGSADTPATSEEAWSLNTEAEIGRALLRLLDGGEGA